MARILMIEDDLELAEILKEFLERFEDEVVVIDDPFIALSTLNVESFDLVILDLTLPGMDGLELLKKLREHKNIPVIISSARSDVSDKVTGLELGADDYMPKPFNPRELEARIKAILRRKSIVEKSEEGQKSSDIILDEAQREIIFKNEFLKLTNAEYEILAYLIQNKNRPIDRDEILESVSALSEDSNPKTIDVIIGRIRGKLGENTRTPRYILSVRGIGYKFIP